MQSQWTPLISSVLDTKVCQPIYNSIYLADQNMIQARCFSKYVPAGSWCTATPSIHDCCIVTAALTNMDDRAYIRATFFLPSQYPLHGLSRYLVSQISHSGDYHVTIREAVSQKKYLRSDAESDYGSISADSGKMSSKADSSTPPSSALIQHFTEDKIKDLLKPSILDWADTEDDDDYCPVQEATSATEVAVADAQCSTPSHENSNAEMSESEVEDESFPSHEDLHLDFGALHRLEAPIHPRARGMLTEFDESLDDSPIRPENIVRPGAPTPLRAGRKMTDVDAVEDSPVRVREMIRPGAPAPSDVISQYLEDDKDEGGDSNDQDAGPEEQCCVSGQEHVVEDDVFGSTPAISGEVAVMSPYLPHVELSGIEVSLPINALDLANFAPKLPIHSTNLEWLDIPLGKYGYHHYHENLNKSREDISWVITYAIEDVLRISHLILKSSNISEQPESLSKLEAENLDLNEWFGYGSTDLDDEYQEPAPDMTLANPYNLPPFSELLGRDVFDLPLSKFISNDGQGLKRMTESLDKDRENEDFYRKTLNVRASEIAYKDMFHGIEQLELEGVVDIQRLHGSFRSTDWFFLIPDEAGEFPEDPRRLVRPELLEYSEPQKEDELQPIHHYSFFWQPVAERSSTPAAVSAWAIKAVKRKIISMTERDRMERLPVPSIRYRKHALIMQSNKYVDVTAFEGPPIPEDWIGEQLTRRIDWPSGEDPLFAVRHLG